MDPAVKAALITGVFSLAGSSVITFFITRFFDQRDLPSMSSARRKALSGRWQGVFHQDVGPSGGPTDYSMKLDLTAKRKFIKAKIHLVLTHEDLTYHILYNAKGSYLDNRFLKMNYESNDPGVLQFGHMILEYTALGNSLVGKFIGFGAMTERMISGKINLNKITQS